MIMNNLVIDNGVLTEHVILSETEADVFIPGGTVAIGEEVFCGCKNIKSVIIPDSVLRIEDFAFQSCTVLNQL